MGQTLSGRYIYAIGTNTLCRHSSRDQVRDSPILALEVQQNARNNNAIKSSCDLQIHKKPLLCCLNNVRYSIISYLCKIGRASCREIAEMNVAHESIMKICDGQDMKQ